MVNLLTKFPNSNPADRSGVLGFRLDSGFRALVSALGLTCGNLLCRVGSGVQSQYRRFQEIKGACLRPHLTRISVDWSLN